MTSMTHLAAPPVTHAVLAQVTAVAARPLALEQPRSSLAPGSPRTAHRRRPDRHGREHHPQIHQVADQSQYPHAVSVASSTRERNYPARVSLPEQPQGERDEHDRKRAADQGVRQVARGNSPPSHPASLPQEAGGVQ